jgi:site-specific DNA recombinase
MATDELHTPAATTLPKRAVIYLRVSTSAQADTDYGSEGYSIPAQREACKRTAAGLEAQVVEEYVDRGESARSANRPALLRMLTRLRDERDIDYVIVHKVDRLARNRADDIEIALTIRAAGAQLVSASENIDQTPSGTLLHGIMATIAEFYSQNLAAEVRKGLLQKVRLGGTPTRAPLGYLNVIERVDGREIRTVAVDPDRAPHVVWMFEQYVTGDWLIRELAEALADRGLNTRPTPKRPEGTAPTPSMVERMLANPYYAGTILFEGVEYPGRHQPLISKELFAEVQAVKTSRRLSKEKPYQHPHYLKGSLFCGTCGDRLGVTKTRNRHGQLYPYFYCLGRQKKRRPCQQPYVNMRAIEPKVEELWRSVKLPPMVREALRREVLALLARTEVEQTQEVGRLSERVATLDGEREKLLLAHYAGAVPLDLLKREQERLSREMETTVASLARLSTELGAVEEGLDAALALVADCHQLYTSAPPHIRRQLNQAVFEQILVEDDEVPTGRLREPFGQLLELADRAEPREEWGSEEQLKRYLRTGPAPKRNRATVEAQIRRILGENAAWDAQVGVPGERRNPDSPIVSRGSNVVFMAEGVGFEPTIRRTPDNGFQDRRIRPLCHPSGSAGRG